MFLWLTYYLYFFFQIILLLYALVEFNLLIRFLRRKNHTKVENLKDLPFVSIQLPIYNEQYVIGRLIDAVCAFDYPKDLMEIQILDDSVDETVEIVAEKVKNYREKGFDIKQVIREERTGFKAGALGYGLKKVKGDFIAIFDADFIPKPDFLTSALPYFDSDDVGAVQTRWTHVNQGYSLLTRIQAVFLNTHFSVEQSGRNESGAFINFNGTAGIWRKNCIEESGGWQSDTLTEDLDLSYRAQLLNWKFKYLFDLESPAELPVSLPAFKNQQFRWSKGGAECARKNMMKLWRSKKAKLYTKIIGSFHLLSSSAYLIIVTLLLLSVPLTSFFSRHAAIADPLGLLNFTYLTTILLFLVFLLGNLQIESNKWKTALIFPVLFPAFIITTMGIALYQMIGVLEGYMGRQSEFVRTPKFNVKLKSDAWRNKSYGRLSIKPIIILEILLLLYCLFALIYSFSLGVYGMTLFVLMFSTGLSINIVSGIRASMKND